MGTHSTITIQEEGKTLVKCYTQYDGYLSGVGKDIADYCMSMTVVNSFSERSDKIANGAGCFAALFIKNFKKSTGNFYITTPDSDDEEFNYTINIEEDSIKINCKELGNSWYTPSDFLKATKSKRKLE